MDKYLPFLFFFLALFAIIFYVFFKFKTNKEFSFARIFPFETNKSSLEIRVSLISLGVFSICSVFYYLNIYFKTFTNNYLFIASLSAFAICILFLLLNIVNLTHLKVHLLIFSLYIALVTTHSVVLGFHAINAYKISGVNVAYLVISILSFVKAFIELLLVSPLFKFSLLMDVNLEEGTIKRPAFIRQALYEWIYLMFFIVDGFLLLIVKSL